MNNLTYLFENFPQTILKHAYKYAYYQKILPKNIINTTYNIKIKYTIMYYFEYFKRIIYNIHTLSTNNPKLTSNLRYRPNKFLRKKTDPTANIVEISLDRQKTIQEFYNCIIQVSYTLTIKEAKYLIYTFIYKKDLNRIAFLLKVNNKTLSYIEKSCLLKVINKLKTSNLELFL